MIDGSYVVTLTFCSYRHHQTEEDDSKLLENSALEQTVPPHIDVWPHLHASSSLSLTDDERRGYTFDSVRNLNVGQHERMRSISGGSHIDPKATEAVIHQAGWDHTAGLRPFAGAASDDELDDKHDDPRIMNYSCRNHSRYARWLRGSQKKEFKVKMCMSI